MRNDRRRILVSVLLSMPVLGAAFLFPGPVTGTSSPQGTIPGTIPAAPTVLLDVPAATYKLGATVPLNGSIELAEGEFRRFSSVQLTIDGPQPCTATLPTAEGTSVAACTPAASGNLSVTVSYDNVIVTDGDALGYGPGDGFLGQTDGGSIDYAIGWQAPVFLSPAPVFSLLPTTTEQFTIPTVPSPTPISGLPDPLPTLTALPNGIPLATTADPGAPADLPTLTDVGSIPSVAPAPIAGVSELPAVDMPAALSNIGSLATTAEGITTDGTNFYILINKPGGGGPDQIVKANATTGALDGTFGGGDGIADLLRDPNGNPGDFDDEVYDEALGIAFIGGTLYVSHNEFFGPNRTILKIDASTGNFLSPFSFNSPSNETYGDLAADGANLWGVDPNGSWARKFTANGVDLGQVNLGGGTATNGLAVDSDLLYVAQGQTIKRFKKDTQQEVGSSIDPTPVGTIRGMTISGGVLSMVDLEAGNVTVYQGQFASGITTNPLGITSDGTDLFLLVDNTLGADKIIKVSKADGSLITGFGTSGAADAPSSSTEGIAFLGGSLWVAFNTSGGFGGAQPQFQEVNASTGAAIGSPINIPFQFNTEVGGLTTDGSNLVAVSKTNNDAAVFGTSGNQLETPFLNSPTFNSGLNGLGYRSSKSQFIGGKTNKIASFTTNFQETGGAFTNLQLSGGGTVVIKGLTLIGDVVYVAHDGSSDMILKASLPTGETTDPTGIAYDGTDLWVVTNSTSGSDKILRLDATTGALLGSFDAPSDSVEGITFIGSDLWVVYKPQFQNAPKFQKINPATGALVGGPVGPDGSFCCLDPGGLTTDGTNLVVVDKQGNNVRTFTTAGSESSSDFINSFELNSGANGLAFRPTKNQYFGGKGAKIVGMNDSFDETSSLLFTGLQAGGQPLVVKGLTFDGAGNILWVADDTTNTVYKTSIPTPPTVITNTPKAMATDGTGLFVVVDASPQDRLLKLDTSGNLVTAFGTNGVVVLPSDNVEGLDFFNDALYAVGNDTPAGCFGFCPAQPTFYKLDKDTGAQIGASFNLSGSPVPNDSIRSLTNNGTLLIAGYGGFPGGGGGSGQWVKLDPSNPNGAQTINQNPGPIPFMEKFGSTLFAVNKLWGLNNAQLNGYTLGPSDASGAVAFNVQNVSDVKGSAYIDTTVYIADATSKKVYGSTFQDNQPELTTFGTYTGQLAVTFNPTVTSDPETFDLVKATTVDVEITDPADGTTVITSPVTVTGTVDDPSITSVILGAELASTTLFEDGAEEGPTSAGKFDVSNSSPPVGWHIDCNDPQGKNSGACSWHYAKDVPGAGDYETPGSPNSGELTIQDIPVGENARLRFWTWYNTEGNPDFDRKLIQVNIEGDSPDAGWQTVRQIVDPFAATFASPPGNAHASFQFVAIPPANMNFGGPGGPGPGFSRKWELVEVDLTPFLGETVDVRFRFNTVDKEANFFEGWYVDDIEIEGKGSGGGADTVPVVNGAFTASFALAEGANQVSITAVNPYTIPIGSLKDIDTITVNLDTTDPIVAITENTVVNPLLPDLITNQASVVINGTFQEFNFDNLKITNVVNEGTADEVRIPVTAQVDTSAQTFTANVLLNEGTNKVTAQVTDGAGRTGADTVLIERDTTAPTATILDTVYPVGVASARSGDPIIFQLDTTDPDVHCVEVLFSSSASSVPPCQPSGSNPNVTPFLRPSDIPQAVRDSWGVTGGWLFPAKVPDASLPGSFGFSVRVVDRAGNVTNTSVNATIAAALSAINIGLMPDENLISLPLIPTDNDPGNLPRLLDLNPTVRDLTEAIWYYDATRTDLAPEDRWFTYTPDGNALNDTLVDLRTGRGYWWITDASQFELSAPLEAGLPQTPKVENFSYEGVFLRKGAEAPPVYQVVSGWNLLGFHSENTLEADEYLAALGRGDARTWSSLLVFDNFIEFPIGEEGEPRFELGHFTRVFGTNKLKPGQGFWLFTTQDGTVTP